MPQQTRVVGLDVAKNKVEACIRSAGLRLWAASTPEGQAELVAWLRADRVNCAVMEASGGYERSWAEVLRAAGVEVAIVDPKRIRHFAKAAGGRRRGHEKAMSALEAKTARDKIRDVSKPEIAAENLRLDSDAVWPEST